MAPQYRTPRKNTPPKKTTPDVKAFEYAKSPAIGSRLDLKLRKRKTRDADTLSRDEQRGIKRRRGDHPTAGIGSFLLPTDEFIAPVWHAMEEPSAQQPQARGYDYKVDTNSGHYHWKGLGHEPPNDRCFISVPPSWGEEDNERPWHMSFWDAITQALFRDSSQTGHVIAQHKTILGQLAMQHVEGVNPRPDPYRYFGFNRLSTNPTKLLDLKMRRVNNTSSPMMMHATAGIFGVSISLFVLDSNTPAMLRRDLCCKRGAGEEVSGGESVKFLRHVETVGSRELRNICLLRTGEGRFKLLDEYVSVAEGDGLFRRWEPVSANAHRPIIPPWPTYSQAEEVRNDAGALIDKYEDLDELTCPIGLQPDLDSYDAAYAYQVEWGASYETGSVVAVDDGPGPSADNPDKPDSFL